MLFMLLILLLLIFIANSSCSLIHVMATSRTICLNDANVFCDICGEYKINEQGKPISDFVKRAYLAYFEGKLGDHVVCIVYKTCMKHLRQWIDGKRRSLKFGVPMVWRQPKNHYDYCYFCMVNIKGLNRNNKSSWTYLDLESARRPVPHPEEVIVPNFNQMPELPMEYDGSDISRSAEFNASDSSTSEFEGTSSDSSTFRSIRTE